MSHVHDLTAGRDPAADSVGLALEVLRRRFPRVCLWFGTSTRRWWAYVGGHLIEAHTPQELARSLDLAATGTSDDCVEIAGSRLEMRPEIRPEIWPRRSHHLSSLARRDT